MSEATPTPAPDLRGILKNLLAMLGLDAEVSERAEGQTLHLEVTGPDADAARGKRGEILDALQYILGKVLGHAGLTEQRVLIDIGTYRAGRDKSIADIGRFLSQKALALKKPIAVNPMGSHDRRAIHTALAEEGAEKVHSQSEGEGLARRLIVVPGPAPKPRPRPEGEDRRPREGDDRGPRREGEDRGPRREGEERGPRREGDDRPPRREGEDRGPRREGSDRDRRPRGERDGNRREDDRGPRREGEEREPQLGTPERPYIMEAPPEPPED